MTARRIAIVVERYLPGYKAGGPLRSISNLVTCLGEEFEFWIITRDRDAGDRQRYPSVRPRSWQQVGNAHVYYASPEEWQPIRLLLLLRQARAQAIYVNSCFAPSTLSVLSLRRLGLIRTPVILAPRGELSKGALSLKSAKKRAFVGSARALGIWKGILWQATAEEEQEEIRAAAGADAEVYLAQNVAVPRYHPRTTPKVQGLARLVFVSRVSPKKNLPFLLERLRTVAGEVRLSVYGAAQEREHLEYCRRIAAGLRSNIRVTFAGAIPNQEVPEALAASDFFVLPTLGENFGHAIIEALAAGCPPIISDRTPWRGLTEKGIGWDLDLNDPGAWESVLQHCVAMEGSEFGSISAKAMDYAARWSTRQEIVAGNRAMLGEACARGARWKVGRIGPS